MQMFYPHTHLKNVRLTFETKFQQAYLVLPIKRVYTGALTDLTFKVVSCDLMSVFHLICRVGRCGQSTFQKKTSIAHTLDKFQSPKRLPARISTDKNCKESSYLFVKKRQRTHKFCVIQLQKEHSNFRYNQSQLRSKLGLFPQNVW